MTSRTLSNLCRLAIVLALPMTASAQTAATRTLPIPPTNPRATVKQFIGPTEVEISYSRPGMKGRQVFGKLVPYDQVWRTGADNATRISFSTEVTVNGTKVPAGTYELFTIPGRDEWTVIIAKHRATWGSYAYHDSNDVARVRAKPVSLPGPVETFSLGVTDLTPGSGVLNVEWERTRVPVTIEVDVVDIMVPHIEAAMKADGRKPYFLAAMFYYENGLDINKAAQWITAAVAEQPDHIGILHRQALILAQTGDTAGAIAAAQKSYDGAQFAGSELRVEYTRLNSTLLDRLRRKR